MSSNILLVIPEATTNLVTNPSLETDTTGYVAANGATLTRIATAQRRGVYSLNIAPTAATDDGVYWPITLVAATEYAHSFDFKGQDKIPYRAYLYDVTGAVILGQPLTFTGDDEWHRYAFIESTLANTSHRLYIVKNNHANTGAFQVDGVQIEANSFATTYCDGDQGGCSWNGTVHASTSTRDGASRQGGKLVDFEDYGFAVEALTGFGAAPISQNVLSYSQLPGSLFDSAKIQSRTMQLALVCLSEDEPTLYNNRRRLIAALSLARYRELEPTLLRYERNERSLEIGVHYDGGLEGNWRELYEKAPLRIMAHDPPYWQETNEVAVTLSFSFGSLSAAYLFRYKVATKTWDKANITSGSGEVDGIARMNDGKYVVVGSFQINGNANMTNVAVFDPVTEIWSALGTGGAVGAVYACAVAPDGTLYIAGIFSSVGGVSAAGIAKWNGSAWSALGTGLAGLSGYGACLAIAPDGLPIVGGQFTTANGVTVNGIAKWTGSTFTGYGSTPGVSAGTVEVRSIFMNLDGTFYAVGLFTTMDGVANTGRIAKWNGSAWVALSAAGGANNTIWTSRRGPDGKLYLAGNFTTIGGVTANRLARYNGTYYEGFNTQLGSGNIYGMALVGNEIWISGAASQFNPPWTYLVDGIGRWNGHAFLTPYIDIVGTATSLAMVNDPAGDVWYSVTSSAAATLHAVTTITYEGDVPAYPVIKIARTGGTSAKLLAIRNRTTGDELLVNIDIYSGEEITFDLTDPNKPISSNLRGENFVGYLQGSAIAKWALYPGSDGENIIDVFMSNAGSPTITGSMRWRNAYESVDGAFL